MFNGKQVIFVKFITCACLNSVLPSISVWSVVNRSVSVYTIVHVYCRETFHRLKGGGGVGVGIRQTERVYV